MPAKKSQPATATIHDQKLEEGREESFIRLSRRARRG